MSRINELKEIIKSAQTEIKQIQSECSHPVSCVTKKYTGNTGSWDRNDDSYTINLHCELCDKSWNFSYNGYSKVEEVEQYKEYSKMYTREIK